MELDSHDVVIDIREKAVKEKEAELCQLRLDRLLFLQELFQSAHFDKTATPAFAEKMAAFIEENSFPENYTEIPTFNFSLNVDVHFIPKEGPDEETGEEATAEKSIAVEEEATSTAVSYPESEIEEDAHDEITKEKEEEVLENKLQDSPTSSETDEFHDSKDRMELDEDAFAPEDSVENNVENLDIALEPPKSVVLENSSEQVTSLEMKNAPEAGDSSTNGMAIIDADVPSDSISATANIAVKPTASNPEAQPVSKENESEITRSIMAQNSQVSGEHPRPEHDESIEPSHKKKRILPPIERMVTRGVTAKLTRSPEKPRSCGPKTVESYSFSSVHSSPKRNEIRRPRRQNESPFENIPEEIQGYYLYAWQGRAVNQPLSKCLNTANKAVFTKDWLLAREEAKQVKVLKRVEEMKANNEWSLRQIKADPGPKRKKTHWDYLLEEMKWMRQDFKQERKWKIAMAYMVAHWILDWHYAEDKSDVCVKVREILVRDKPLTPKRWMRVCSNRCL
ncbi:HSA-domain-containing protein [Chytridium lagenaria]|nr:HSA-domain-containing protein [Chytridium lagenaria]